MTLRKKATLAQLGVGAILLLQLCVHAGQPSRANSKAVEDVRTGKRKEARAAWWGFDRADSTAALQAAIDSGAEKVALEDLGSPWIVGPITLADNQELVLEKGVVLQAKREAFRGKGDCLLTATGKRNVAITGRGATIRMWKQDYAKPPYEKSEWRHAISIRGCANVRIAGLTIASSGGDGIYLGAGKNGETNRNTVIRDVVCDDNNRQGISVITADTLLIENCTLKNTDGMSPRAGIDFEPNRPSERLVNCAMRNCAAENNQGDGYLFALMNLGKDSAKISIRLENCRSSGNRNGLRFILNNAAPDAAVLGSLDVVDCKFENPRANVVRIVSKPASAARVRFIRCLMARPGMPAAILFLAPSKRRNRVKDIGGVEFLDCAVKEQEEPQPICLDNPAGDLRLIDVTGTIAMDRDGKTTRYTLNKDGSVSPYLQKR
jgi:hypothetical protein